MDAAAVVAGLSSIVMVVAAAGDEHGWLANLEMMFPRKKRPRALPGGLLREVGCWSGAGRDARARRGRDSRVLGCQGSGALTPEIGARTTPVRGKPQAPQRFMPSSM